MRRGVCAFLRCVLCVRVACLRAPCARFGCCPSLVAVVFRCSDGVTVQLLLAAAMAAPSLALKRMNGSLFCAMTRPPPCG